MSKLSSTTRTHRSLRWLIGPVAFGIVLVAMLAPSAQAASCPPPRTHTGQQLDALGVPGEGAAQVKEAELCATVGLPTVAAAPIAPEDGFDWADAGIGVAASFGAFLLAATGVIALRRRGRIAHSSA